MKDFHSYTIQICDGSWNKLPGEKVDGVVIQKYEESNTCGRANRDDVLKWLENLRNEFQERLDEMKKKTNSLVVFARLPVRQHINGECFHQTFESLPSDITAIDSLKERVNKYYLMKQE